MEIIRNKRLILSIITVIVAFMSLHLTAKIAEASTADFYDTKSGVVYKASEYRTKPTVFNELLSGLEVRPNDFVYERSAKGFNYQKLLDSIMTKMDQGKDLATAYGESIVDQTIQVAIPTSEVTFEVMSIE